MKKNLRIVSAAAAALLAVAPIASVAVSNPAVVNAAATTNIDFGTTSAVPANAQIALTSTITATAAYNHVPSTISGHITASFGGQSYLANLPTNQGVYVYTISGGTHHAANVKDLKANRSYYVDLGNGASLNFGSANANRDLTISIPSNMTVTVPTGSQPTSLPSGVTAADYTNASNKTLTVHTDQNGVVSLGKITISGVHALNLENRNGVNFYEIANGNQVTSGSVSINALNGGRLNISSVVAAIQNKYAARQVVNASSSNNNHARLVNADPSATELASAVRSALTQAGVTVDANGFFTAPSSFVVPVRATSSSNNATATLNVTVNVPNANTPAQEASVSETIMHIAQYYNGKGAKTTVSGQSTIGAYNSVSVVKEANSQNPRVYTINGGQYFKIANQDAYIKVGNIRGTQRTLSHNAYLYHRTASGKFVAKTHRVHKKTRHVVVKKGTQETTYGSALYGKKYYRIGRNQYIKVGNFR